MEWNRVKQNGNRWDGMTCERTTRGMTWYGVLNYPDCFCCCLARDCNDRMTCLNSNGSKKGKNISSKTRLAYTILLLFVHRIVLKFQQVVLTSSVVGRRPEGFPLGGLETLFALALCCAVPFILLWCFETNQLKKVDFFSK
mmetsp:Transcript_17088/g.46967  ORF Transcript_17088/g.46967 Transcript_17088/m.46967 type:complete len:141 (+) Transcript_17088:244-666(+)